MDSPLRVSFQVRPLDLTTGQPFEGDGARVDHATPDLAASWVTSYLTTLAGDAWYPKAGAWRVDWTISTVNGMKLRP